MTTATKEPLRTDDGDLACLDCEGHGGGMVIVRMADEEGAECEACDGFGYRRCEICSKRTPGVIVVEDGTPSGMAVCTDHALELAADAAAERAVA
jgi:hypothetical protein